MKVTITTHVHMLLSAYAMSNELQEICCLLLGTKTDSSVHVTVPLFTTRKQRLKDRVEISSEQLSEAISKAERLGLTVVGWMHSHPHITVLPSHIDLATQLNFQSLDPRFLGLIYSCFHENQSRSQRLQVIAFQAEEAKMVKIPLVIVPSVEKEHEAFLILTEMIDSYYKEEQSNSSWASSAYNINKLQSHMIAPILYHFTCQK